ncbi:hypothetical protein FRC08_004871 [Ceratobasidium sp. 394]|nr:hypothetical protein FRC08_004871 [Ceratobasidium sp. 394]
MSYIKLYLELLQIVLIKSAFHLPAALSCKMGKVRRSTRANRKPKHSPSPVPSITASDQSQDKVGSPEKRSTMPCVAFTFGTLRDLILILSDKQPWAAPHGTTGQVWAEISQTLNDRHSLNPPVGAPTVWKKATQLRRLHEDGETPEKLRLPLTSEQHIEVASILDTMVTAWVKWEEKKNGKSLHKEKNIQRQQVLGAQVRQKAIQDLSACEPAPTPIRSPSRHNTPTRAMSAPPTGSRHRVPSVSALVAEITSAVDRAEGMRAQRAEAFQREQIRAIRDNNQAMLWIAVAVEQISSILSGLQDRLPSSST